jgi:hypothetical protein
MKKLTNKQKQNRVMELIKPISIIQNFLKLYMEGDIPLTKTNAKKLVRTLNAYKSEFRHIALTVKY